MLGLAVLFFVGLWLIAIILSLIWGWKIARRMTRSAGKPIGIWIGFIGMALGFYASVGFYIHKEWLLYRKEKALVETFCAENPRVEVFITPEELEKITEKNIYKYGQYRYKLLAAELFRHDESIIFQGIRYEKFDLDNDDGLELFKYYLDSGQSILRKAIYVDSNKKLILYRVTEAKAIGTFNPNVLGEKSWFGNIHDCELTKKERDIKTNLFIRFQHIMENIHG